MLAIPARCDDIDSPSPATRRARRQRLSGLLRALWPLCLLLPASLWLIASKADFVIAGYWFSLQGGEWALRDAFWTETLVHQGGRAASLLAWLAVLIAAARAHRQAGGRWQAPLRYLAAAVLLSVAMVSLAKHGLSSDCPWDMQAFGGKRPTLSILDPRPADLPAGHCFPAGHASAGYAWVALYFALAAAGVRCGGPRLGLLAALGAGAVFGLSQQLRGAHFLSHDLWTLAICWCSALALRPMLRPREIARS